MRDPGQVGHGLQLLQGVALDLVRTGPEPDRHASTVAMEVATPEGPVQMDMTAHCERTANRD
jgi:hypothetical protein